MTGTSMHRVAEQTKPQINDDIRRQTEMRLAYYAQHTDEIDQRLRELEEEWDINRVLALNSSVLTLLGLLMGLRKTRWMLLSMVVQGFYLQHTIQGWCPPVELLRRLGYREPAEVATEYHALLAMKDGHEAPEEQPARVKGRKKTPAE